MVRAKPGARAITDRTKAILLNLDKDVRVDVLTMSQMRWKLLASERFRTAVLLVFAGTATFLALIGIFGLVSYTVAQRHREIGLRVALGATYSRVVSLMLRQALTPAVVGIVGWDDWRPGRQSVAGRVSLRSAGDRSCDLQRRHRPVLVRRIRRRPGPGSSKLPRRSRRRAAP
jgi:hypothetical protein